MVKRRLNSRLSIAAASVAVVAAVAVLVVSAQVGEHGSPTTAPPPTKVARPTTAPAGNTTTTAATVGPPDCWPNAAPIGALPDQPPPVFCTDLVEAHPTFTSGQNSWVDDFQHGHSFAEMGEGYRIFNDPQGDGIHQIAYWRHADHWMVDVNGRDQHGGAPWNQGGTMVRPDRSFRFENGRLVVEMVVAAGISTYAGTAWPEIVVSTAPEPHSPPADGLYAYGWFAGDDAVGIRLADRFPQIAYYPASGPRAYELPLRPSPGAVQTGGGPFGPAGDAAWRTCIGGQNPDTDCRDVFRWELTRTTLKLYVNGVEYHTATNLAPLADAMVNGEVYVYAASWMYKPSGDTVRFHWDRFAVNP